MENISINIHNENHLLYIQYIIWLSVRISFELENIPFRFVHFFPLYGIHQTNKQDGDKIKTIARAFI